MNNVDKIIEEVQELIRKGTSQYIGQPNDPETLNNMKEDIINSLRREFIKYGYHFTDGEVNIDE